MFDDFYYLHTSEVSKLQRKTAYGALHFKVFTDNIVLGHPFYSEDGENEFAFCLWAIQEYQLTMALNGFFIRGGMSMGPLYMDDNTVYGPAILDAYKLESVTARDPRVVIDDSVLSLIKSQTTFYSDPKHAPQNSDILIDSDGKGYINYLEALVDRGDELTLDIKRLIIHKHQIMLAAERYYKNPNIWPKYFWLCNYHNYFCKTVSTYSHFKSDAIIPDSFFRREPTKLIE